MKFYSRANCDSVSSGSSAPPGPFSIDAVVNQPQKTPAGTKRSLVRFCVGSNGSAVQIRPPRPSFFSLYQPVPRLTGGRGSKGKSEANGAGRACLILSICWRQRETAAPRLRFYVNVVTNRDILRYEPRRMYQDPFVIALPSRHLLCYHVADFCV